MSSRREEADLVPLAATTSTIPPVPHPTFHFIPTNSSDKSNNNNVSGNFSLYLQNSFSLKERRDGIRQRWNYNRASTNRQLVICCPITLHPNDGT